MDILVRPASFDDVGTIADRMRKADVVEVEASSDQTPVSALETSLARSSFAMTVLIDGRPEIMFGVGDVNVLTGTGAPWMLATDEIGKIKRQFLKSSAGWCAQLLQRYDVLINCVDDRNKLSKRWLAWLGFTIGPPVAFGKNGELFRVFEMRR